MISGPWHIEPDEEIDINYKRRLISPRTAFRIHGPCDFESAVESAFSTTARNISSGVFALAREIRAPPIYAAGDINDEFCCEQTIA